MKRQLESMMDDRPMKKPKLEEMSADLEFLPDLFAFPLEVLHLIIKYLNVESTATLLQATKITADILEEKSWKFLYAFKWQEWDSKNIGVNGLAGIELILREERNDYVEERFYDPKNTWRNLYCHRSQLEAQFKCKSISDVNPKDCEDRKALEALAIYDENPLGVCEYGNLELIESYNKRNILAIHARRLETDFVYEDECERPLENNCRRPIHMTIIGELCVPVQFRVEIVDRAYFGFVAKMYCNLRILAFNTKTQLWDVVVGHYSNYAVEEDQISLYMPHYATVSHALFTTRTEGKLFWAQHDLFKVICAAANVPHKYRRANTEGHVDLIVEDRGTV